MTSTPRDPVVLAIRLRQFGDVLSALGALRAVKAQWPGGRVVYAVDGRFHPVLRGLDFIDDLLASPPRVRGRRSLEEYVRYVARIRSMRPTAVLDFHGNARSALLSVLSGARVRAGFAVRGRRHAYTTVEPRAVVDRGVVRPRTSLEAAVALARRIGVEGEVEATPPEIPVSSDAIRRGRELLVDSGVPEGSIAAGEVVGLNAGKPYPAKAWPRERFVSLAKRLVESGRHVVALWGPGEEGNAREIVDAVAEGTTLAPGVTIGELPGLIRCLSVVVTIDSGLKHLAVCVRVPTVTLFGSTDPREWHIGTPADRYLWRARSCSPCRRFACPFGNADGAPCMDFEPDEVLDTLKALERVV